MRRQTWIIDGPEENQAILRDGYGTPRHLDIEKKVFMKVVGPQA
jgi:hypothetical protein